MAGDIDLNAHCRALMLQVAALDDAGLPLEHKRLIALAKKLRRLREAQYAEMIGNVRTNSTTGAKP